MISKTCEYALRAAVCLAGSAGTPMACQRIADATRVPAGYLSKVLQSMARAGVVSSRRGPAGGFVLTRPAEQVTVLEVVEAVGPLERAGAEDAGPEAEIMLDALHDMLESIVEAAARSMRATTLGDLIAASQARGVEIVAPRGAEAGEAGA